MITSPAIALKPCVYTTDLSSILSLSSRFATVDLLNIPATLDQGMHVALVDKNTPEVAVRQWIYRILASGNSPHIYHSQQPIAVWAGDESTSVRELSDQIMRFSQDYDQWLKTRSQNKLTLQEAVQIAQVVMAYEQEPQRSVELGILRVRCGESSYDWNNLIRKLENEGQHSSGDSKPKKLTLREASEKARVILQAQQDELESNLKLEEVRAACGMGSGDWEQKIIKPLKRELEVDRFKLDLIYVLGIDDQVERIRQQALLAPKYQMSAAMLAQAIAAMKQRTSTPEVKIYDLDELFDLKSEGIDWLIPELLPKGETIILAASPKAGKTLLAIDAAFAIATGESDFLGQKTKRGKVLLISVDESLNSTKSKLLKRGFRHKDKEYIRVLPLWTIDQMGILEAELEDFRPDVVIVDSLRRINHGSPISENSAEFADNIYTLKETFGRYGASGVLIHHNNKDSDALGVGRIRGSSAIAGAVWGTWQLDHIPKKDPNNKKKLIIDPKDPKRVLTVFARDAEGQTFNIEFNPEDNSWVRLGSDTPEAQEEKTLKERILNILGINQSGLSGSDIIEILGMTKEEGRGVYTTLNRMVSKRIISCKPAPGDKRYNIYTLPIENFTPPPPTHNDPNVEYYPETLNQRGLDNTQHNTQHPEKITQHLNEVIHPVECSNPDTVNNTEILNTSTENIGGGGKIPSVEYSETENESVLSNTSETCLAKSSDVIQEASPQVNSASEPLRKRIDDAWNDDLKLGEIVIKADPDEWSRVLVEYTLEQMIHIHRSVVIVETQNPDSLYPSGILFHPEFVAANADLIKQAIADSDRARIAEFSKTWKKEFKKAVLAKLSPEERKQVKRLKELASKSEDELAKQVEGETPPGDKQPETPTVTTNPESQGLGGWKVGGKANYCGEIVSICKLDANDGSITVRRQDGEVINALECELFRPELKPGDKVATAATITSDTIPGEVKKDNSYSLLDLEKAGDDVAGFVGRQIEVRPRNCPVKFTGKMIGYDEKNGFVTITTEEGDKNIFLFEAFVVDLPPLL